MIWFYVWLSLNVGFLGGAWWATLNCYCDADNQIGRGGPLRHGVDEVCDPGTYCLICNPVQPLDDFKIGGTE